MNISGGGGKGGNPVLASSCVNTSRTHGSTVANDLPHPPKKPHNIYYHIVKRHMEQLARDMSK